MNDYLDDVEETLAKLTKGSKQSMTMIILSAVLLLGSVVYSATRLAPLERDIHSKKTEIAGLELAKAKISKTVELKRQELEDLRSNINKLYAVKLTGEDKVVELRASAKLSDHVSGQGPLYRFVVFINAAQQTLDSIIEVIYVFDHPTFSKPRKVSNDSSNNFKVGYLGWGCLTSVSATLRFESGETTEIKFNMCKSLGPQWWNDRDDKNAVYSESSGESTEKVARKRPIDDEGSDTDELVQKLAPDTNGGTSNRPTEKTPPRKSCGSHWANGPENPCPAGCYQGQEVDRDIRVDRSNPLQPRKIQPRRFECWMDR